MTTWILLSVVLAGLAYGGIRWWTSERVDKMLQQYATSLNVYCPRDLEPAMSLKRVVVLPNRTLVYNIVSELLTPEMLTQEDPAGLNRFAEEARQKAIRTLRADPNLSQIKRLGITFVYRYKTAEGGPLMEFTIAPEDYR